MALKIDPADLATKVYSIGHYFEADETTRAIYNSAFCLRNVPKSPTTDERCNEVIDKDKHFVLGCNPLSFFTKPEAKLHSDDVPAFKLHVRPASDGDKIIYLPYHPYNITSTGFPTDDASIRYFITDGMSGCNMYIDELVVEGRKHLVCYHANALHKKTKKLAQDAMDEMHRNAQAPGAKNVATLRTADYFAKAEASEVEEVPGQSSREFVGGTTVMGFRKDDGRWVFHLQTYGRITYVPTPERGIAEEPSRKKGIAGKVMGKLTGNSKGKGKEEEPKRVEAKAVPLKIIDHGPLPTHR